MNLGDGAVDLYGCQGRFEFLGCILFLGKPLAQRIDENSTRTPLSLTKIHLALQFLQVHVARELMRRQGLRLRRSAGRGTRIRDLRCSQLLKLSLKLGYHLILFFKKTAFFRASNSLKIETSEMPVRAAFSPLSQ